MADEFGDAAVRLARNSQQTVFLAHLVISGRAHDENKLERAGLDMRRRLRHERISGNNC